MKLIFTCALSMLITALSGQNIYSKTFGNKSNPALIFLHGGPGYNCANFELTTAQKLADEGYYVIVYDRRGEGRSKDDKAKFNFEETFSDLNTIYKQYGIKQAGLIGHSFGGIVATLFAEKFPKKISTVILVGAPVNLQETFLSILDASKKLYIEKQDTMNLKYIGMIEKMDPKSMMYASYCFGHAMQNGFYSPKNRSEEAKQLYTSLVKDSSGHHAMEMSIQAPQGFLANEKYTSIDLTSNIKNLVAKKMKIFALYGKEDGLYSAKQVEQTASLLGKGNLLYIENCSHSVFIDQQAEFVAVLKKWMKY
ncbi:MAG TPA: alpha/beta hydrolase [Bacteroidia bacterium]